MQDKQRKCGEATPCYHSEKKRSRTLGCQFNPAFAKAWLQKKCSNISQRGSFSCSRATLSCDRKRAELLSVLTDGEKALFWSRSGSTGPRSGALLSTVAAQYHACIPPQWLSCLLQCRLACVAVAANLTGRELLDGDILPRKASVPRSAEQAWFCCHDARRLAVVCRCWPSILHWHTDGS